MPSFIFVAIFVAINLVGINVNLVKVETEIQSGRPGRGLQFDYLLTIYGVAGSCLAPRLLVLCSALLCTTRLENSAAKCTRSPGKAKANDPVKILLTGITNFYG
jgi:hypothetical protein